MANLDNKIMKKLWIARDWDGSLYVYTDKPDLFSEMIFMRLEPLHTHSLALDEDFYPEVTFENSPLQLEVSLN